MEAQEEKKSFNIASALMLFYIRINKALEKWNKAANE